MLSKNTGRQITLSKSELVSLTVLQCSVSFLIRYHQMETKFNPKKLQENCFKFFMFLPSCLPTRLILSKQKAWAGTYCHLKKTTQYLSLSLFPSFFFSFLSLSFFFEDYRIYVIVLLLGRFC